MHVFVGPHGNLLFELLMFRLFFGGGCQMLGVTTVFLPELFITVTR